MKILPDITFSIVSHGQSGLVKYLLDDLSALSNQNFRVIVTVNIPEDETPYLETSLNLDIIRNVSPKGFGENHNQAFKAASTSYFCVLNPDLRIHAFNLDDLLIPFRQLDVGAVSPLVLSPGGNIEDNARRFPTFSILVRRTLFRERQLDYQINLEPVTVEWVAGMFIVFRRDAYDEVNGFDASRFFMYLEDADICRRLAMKGWKVQVNPLVQVIHAAQRASRRKFQHMRWHVISAFRFLTGF